eukprot:140786-Amphidinium_carterae.1
MTAYPEQPTSMYLLAVCGGPLCSALQGNRRKTSSAPEEKAGDRMSNTSMLPYLTISETEKQVALSRSRLIKRRQQARSAKLKK